MVIKFLLIAKRVVEYLLLLNMSIIIIVLSLHVVLRYFFRFSFSWSSELSTYLLVWLTFLGAILALFDEEHIGFTTLQKKVNKKANFTLKIIKNLVISVFLGVIFVYGVPVIMMVWSFKAITFPVSRGLLYLVVPFSSILMLVYIITETVLLYFPEKLKLFYKKIKTKYNREQLIS